MRGIKDDMPERTAISKNPDSDIPLTEAEMNCVTSTLERRQLQAQSKPKERGCD